MGTLTSVCCVCGTVYSQKPAPNIDGDRISHGFCNDACTKSSAVQSLFWDKDMGFWNAGRAFIPAGSEMIFSNGQFLRTFVSIEDNRVELCLWDSDVKEYLCPMTCIEENNSRAYEVAKIMASNQKCDIINLTK